MTPNEENNWERKSALFHKIALGGAGVLVIGLVIETMDVFEYIHSASVSHETLSRLGTLLVTIGVAIEVVFAWWGGKYDDRIKAGLREQIIKLRTPRRRVMRGNETSISLQLSRFAGTEFDTGMSMDGEQADIAWDLQDVLVSAGWQHVPWIGLNSLTQGSRPPSGHVGAENIEIHLHPESRPVLEPAAHALIAALNDIGIDAADAGFNSHSPNTNAIHIAIGLKQ